MKRYGNLYSQIYDIDNLRLAHSNARRGKGWYKDVKAIDKDTDEYLYRLQAMLINHEYHTSPYEKFIRKENGKEREIYKLPYFPDRICQWAIMQIIEPYLIRSMTNFTYSALPGRGIHKAKSSVEKALKTDKPNCEYCLKLDIRHFYPSINHQILKDKFRRMFKDKELIYLLDEIIDSINTAKIEDNIGDPETGVPIGNYLSQYCGNFYLSALDHFSKEQLHAKHYFRYMDDIVILSDSKDELHGFKNRIFQYVESELKLKIKGNWQIFPTFKRGIDFLGYRFFGDYTLLRKSTCKRFKRKMTAIRNKTLNGQMMNYSEWCVINSYKGWLKWCDSYRLQEKYLKPLEKAVEEYYTKVIKTQKGGKNVD